MPSKPKSSEAKPSKAKPSKAKLPKLGAPRPTAVGGLPKALVWALAALVVVIAGFGGHLVLARRHALLAQASSARAETAKLDGRYSQGKKIEASAAAYQSRLGRGRLALPATRDQAGLIAEIDSVAAASGVTWSSGAESSRAPAASSTSSTPPAGTSGHTGAPVAPAPISYDLSLRAKGSPSQVAHFVSALQSMPRVITIDTLSLSLAKHSSGATMSLVFYSSGGVA